MSSWGWGHVLPVHPELHTVGCHSGTLCVRSPCPINHWCLCCYLWASISLAGLWSAAQQQSFTGLERLSGGSSPWGQYCPLGTLWLWQYRSCSWHLVPRAPECSQCSRTWINSTLNPFSCQGEGNTQWKLSPELNTRARNRICVTDLGPWTL